MTITLNGKSHDVPGDGSAVPVNEFLASLDLGDHPVLVELNGKALLAREFAEHSVRDGDTVEVIRMVAGG